MLSVLITEQQMVVFVESVAVLVSSYTGLSVSYGILVTVTAVGVLTVLGFAWGYVFHHTRFE
jgi:hypothetical protein